jgi:hypothetical protein
VISRWDELHERYREIADRYVQQRAEHAVATLRAVYTADTITPELWREAQRSAAETQRLICARTRESRTKDYENPFRMMTYDSTEEMARIVGDLEENSFIKTTDEFTERFCSLLEVD